MKKLMATLTLVLAVVTLAPATAHAQAANGALDRVHNLIATGRFTEANNTLEQWERSYGDPRSEAVPADRAKALYLRALLTGDAAQAEDAYMTVVLSYPSSAVAADALLRLGQGLLTAGEPRRAAAYLERLRSDYPGTTQRETGMLWLSRAHLAAGNSSAACSTARDGLDGTAAPNLRMLLELERDRACVGTAAAPGAAAPAAAAPAAVAPAVPATEQAVPPPAPRPAVQPPPQPERALRGEYAVQTGAYREFTSAQNIAQQMRARGFEVRVVTIRGSPLHRVRVGEFATIDEAAAATRAIRDAGFATVIVSDVRQEN
jgi:cell division septation protein DedD